MKDYILFTGLIIVTGLLIASPTFKEGFPIAQDNPSHLAVSYFVVEDLLSKGKLFGWANIESAGFPLFIYNYPLGFWIVAAIHFLFGLSVVLSYKILLAISYLFPILIMFFILDKLFGKIAAAITSVLLLFQFDFISFVFSGLWGQYLGLVFGLLYIYILFKTKRLNFRISVLLGILLAMTFLAHPFTSVFLVYFTITLLIVRLLDSKLDLKNFLLQLSVGWLISIVIVSVLFLKPFIDSSSLLSKSEDLTSNKISTIAFKSLGYLFLPHLRAEALKTKVGWISGEIGFGSVVKNFGELISLSLLNIAELFLGLLALLGLTSFLKSKKRLYEMKIAFVVLLISVIIASGILTYFSLSKLPLIGNLFQFPRYFVYARLMLAFFAAYATSFLFKFFAKANALRKFPLKSPFLIGIVGYLILLVSFVQIQGLINLKTSTGMDEISQVNTIWDWLKNNVDTRATRVFYQNTFGNFDGELKNSHIFALSAYNTKIESLGTWQGGFPLISKILYTGNGQLLGRTVSEISDTVLAETMKVYNARYIVASESTLKGKLVSSTLFAENFTSGKISIFSLKNYSQSLVMMNDKEVPSEILYYEPGKIKMKFVAEKGTYVVKVSYHPYWTALANGKKIALTKDDFGLISFEYDKSEDVTLELTYNPF